jgi:hypothetical protein
MNVVTTLGGVIALCLNQRLGTNILTDYPIFSERAGHVGNLVSVKIDRWKSLAFYRSYGFDLEIFNANSVWNMSPY